MEWWWQGATLYVDDVFLCGKDVGGGLVREGAVGVACLVVWGGGMLFWVLEVREVRWGLGWGGEGRCCSFRFWGSVSPVYSSRDKEVAQSVLTALRSH